MRREQAWWWQASMGLLWDQRLYCAEEASGHRPTGRPIGSLLWDGQRIHISSLAPDDQLEEEGFPRPSDGGGRSVAGELTKHGRAGRRGDDNHTRMRATAPPPPRQNICLPSFIPLSSSPSSYSRHCVLEAQKLSLRKEVSGITNPPIIIIP